MGSDGSTDAGGHTRRDESDTDLESSENSDDMGWEDDADFESGGYPKSSKNMPNRCGWQYITAAEAEVMMGIERRLREKRWSIGKFLIAWTRNGRLRSRVRQLHKALRDPMLQPTKDDSGPVKTIATRIRKEWAGIAGHSPFCKELPNVAVEELDPRSALDILFDQAPLWSALLQSLLRPQRVRGEKGGNGVSIEIAQRMVFITIVFLGVFARRSTAGFRLALGCYLHDAGLSQRGNMVLAGFGVVPTYKYIVGAIEEMAERGKVCFLQLLFCDA